MPKEINPDDNGMADYTNATVAEDGLLIKGRYERLALTGLYLPKLGLTAYKGSSAKLAILSGIKAPRTTIDLRELETERLHMQGLKAGYVELGNKQTGLVDVSASDIDELALGHPKDYSTRHQSEPYRMSLIARDAKINRLELGYSEESVLSDFDLRGAWILSGGGFIPVIRDLYMDGETDMPDEFRKRLETRVIGLIKS